MSGKADIIAVLHERAGEIRARFGVSELRLFGSAARGQATESSDADILVRFRKRATFDGYMDLKSYLEELLGRPVDLVTEAALKEMIKPQILRDSIHVA